MLYIDDQDCDGACHLKNYSFIITYLLEDEQELSLGMLDTSQTYLQFLMLHAYLYTICFVFCSTSWRFYAFSRTNLLTRCHSASSPFSAIFVFQKSYIRNILGIGRNKSRTSYFYRSFAKTEDETEGARSQAHTTTGLPLQQRINMYLNTDIGVASTFTNRIIMRCDFGRCKGKLQHIYICW
jgi:hypothetical protein